MTAEALPQNFDELDGNIVFSLNPMATAVASESATRKEQEHVGAEILSMLTSKYKDRVKFVPPNEDPVQRRTEVRGLIIPGSVIVVCGGDGSVVEIVDFLRSDAELAENLRSTAIVHAPFGNANNTASELTPYREGNMPRILDILQDGWIIDAYGSTLSVSSDHPESKGIEEEVTDFTAVSCHSIQVGGNVGNALEQVRGNSLRRNRYLRGIVDGIAAKKAVNHTDPIEMTINGESVRGVGSIGVSSQSYLRALNTPASMAEQAFYEATIEKGSTPYLAKVLISHLLDRLDWRRVEGDEVLRYELTAQPGQQLYIETDAEPHPLPSHPDEEVNIRVDVSPQKQPFRIFADNPALIGEY